MKRPAQPRYPCALATALGLLATSSLATSAEPLDLDADGLPDVWQQLHTVSGQPLVADGDPDADGFTNRHEADAGTDPFDPASSFNVTSTALDGRSLGLAWPSVAGKVYRLHFSKDLLTWSPETTAHPGSGAPLEITLGTPPGQALLAGAVRREVWLGVRGEHVADLTGHAAFPDAPSAVHTLPALQCPPDDGDHFGARLTGYLVPTTTGRYTLTLSSRHDSQFFLSRDADPDNRRLLLSVPGTPDADILQPDNLKPVTLTPDAIARTRTPAPVELTAGQLYYFELLHKAADGHDFCEVTWKSDRMPEAEVIPAANLAAPLVPTRFDRSAPHTFVRVGVTDLDTDGDGATDWEEHAVGYHPFIVDSAVPGQRDGETLARTLGTETNTFTLTTTEPAAFETGANGLPAPAVLRVTRSGNFLPASVKLSVAGTATPGTDYLPPPATVDFPFAVNTVEVPITPVADTHLEVPEQLTAKISAAVPDLAADTPASVDLTLEDYEVQFERLFLAQLSPQDGAATTASGISTLFLSGDHTSCRISLDFSNLTSPQTAAHVHLDDNGDILHGLPFGVFVDDVYPFPVGGASILPDQQAILDALTSGRFYINVHSTEFPHGEIRGDYLEVEGSIEFNPPPDPPDPPVYTGEELTRDHIRFLTQATFGPTQADLNVLTVGGIDAWLTAQMDGDITPHTPLLDYTQAADTWEWLHNEALGESGHPAYNPEFEPRHHNRRRGWWLAASHAPDQLRQRVAFALSEIFVTSEENSRVRSRHYGLASYYDTLARNAFGNFRDLLEEVTLHPVMGYYLSMVQNAKADPVAGTSPDENYAREVMQLFSVGLVTLHPDGTVKLSPATGLPTATYDNDDITELARVFTGWSYAVQQIPVAGVPPWENDNIVPNNAFYYGGGSKYLQAAYTTPMKHFAAFHDTGAKTIIGETPVPAGQPGELDLEVAMDTLFNHPNTGPFIARRLIQRLVTANPSRGYVYRVAQVFADDGSGTRGNLGAVVRAVLTDYEARALELADDVGYGKPREPLLRLTALFRAFGAASGLPLSDFDGLGYTHNYPAGTTRLRMPQTDNALAQTPQAAPSVFNWFLPDYTVPGAIADAGLVAPELQTVAETTVVTATNYTYTLTFSSSGLYGQPVPGLDPLLARVAIDRTPLDNILAVTGEALLVDYLDLLLCASSLTDEAKATITTAVVGTSAAWKVQTALYLVANSPGFAIQK